MNGHPRERDYLEAVVSAVDFIESSLAEEIDLERVARRVHLSKYYFSRIFPAMVGETVFDYIRKRRLSEIAHRLVTTDTPMVDLALQWGYESQQSMTKAFRRQFGESPGAYRRAGRDRYFFHRPRLSRPELERLHRDLNLRAHVASLPQLRIVGLRARMPITQSDPVDRTRKAFLGIEAGLRPRRTHRGIFEVTLFSRAEMRVWNPTDSFEGLIGYAVSEDVNLPEAPEPGDVEGGSPDAAGRGSASAADPEAGARAEEGVPRASTAQPAELRIPASRYLVFHYRGSHSIQQLSSRYHYIFSSGLADRRERLADRAFFHYYRRGASSMLFFLPIDL